MRPWFLGLVFLLAGCEVGMAPRTPVRSVLVLSTLGTDDELQLTGLLNAAVSKAAGRIGAVTVRLQHLKTNSMRELPAEVRPFVESQRWAAIVTTNLALARIVQRQDPKTPIVFRGAADPVWMCVVDSMRSPGRNATGYTAYLPAEHKMAEALLDAYPALTQLVVLLHGREAVPDDCGAAPLSPKPVRPPCSVAEVPAAVADVHLAASQLVDMAAKRHVRLRFLQLCDAADFEQLKNLAGAGAQTGYVVPLMYLFHANAQGIVDVLARTGLPAIFPRHSFSERGGLMSLAPVHPGPEEARDPELLVRILAGATPAQLSVQVPTGFDLQINLKTAQTLNLTPSAFALSRAVRLIE